MKKQNIKSQRIKKYMEIFLLIKFHPAAAPDELIRDHIISWSNKNDIVFDPMMGSGTTGKMAILNNRNFIGIEKELNYFNIAKNRIENAEEEMISLFEEK